MFRRNVLWFLVIIYVFVFQCYSQIPNIGGRIVFVSNRDGNCNLWVMDIQTLEAQKITNFPEALNIIEINQPQWSKDGEKVLFTGWDGLYPIAHNFYVVDLGTLQVTKMTNFQRNLGYTSRWDSINPDCFYYQECQGWGNEVFHKFNIITRQDITIPSSNPPNSSGTLGFDITTDGNEILFNRDQNYQYSYVGYQELWLEEMFELFIQYLLAD